jgi:hypothetical protein
MHSLVVGWMLDSFESIIPKPSFEDVDALKKLL